MFNPSKNGKTVALFGKLTTSRYGNISISCVLCEKLMPNSKQIAKSESAASDNRQEVKDASKQSTLPTVWSGLGWCALLWSGLAGFGLVWFDIKTFLPKYARKPQQHFESSNSSSGSSSTLSCVRAVAECVCVCVGRWAWQIHFFPQHPQHNNGCVLTRSCGMWRRRARGCTVSGT